MVAIGGVYYYEENGRDLSAFSVAGFKEFASNGGIDVGEISDSITSTFTSFTKRTIVNQLSEDDSKNATSTNGADEDADASEITELDVSIEETAANGHIQAIVNNFESIATQRFEIAGKPQIERFWFVGETDTYVEYRDGKGFRRMLITFPPSVEAAGGATAQYDALGYFVPGENGWILTIGQDKVFGGKQFHLYEFEARRGAWERQN